MKQLLNKILKISVLILTMYFTGCTNDEETLYPQVVAGFTHTINVKTGTVTFINISENTRTYLWNFGDGTTSTEINPIKTFVTGTYTITLKASNDAGASDTFEDTIVINIPNPITLPITFDTPNVAYEATTFAGAAFEIIANPDLSGTNNVASKVGAITNSGNTFEGLFFDLGTRIDLTTKKTITMNFWANAAVNVLMKLENGTGPAIEFTASHTGGGWKIISFDFNSSNKYSRLTLFVDGPGTTAGTFYIDDILQIVTPTPPCANDANQSLNAADFNLTFKTDPTASFISDGASIEWVNNPNSNNTLNSSCKVGKILKSGNQPWDNNQINVSSKFDFNANAGFKIKVFAARTGFKVRIKLEEIGNPGNNSELEVTSTKTNEWEELTFPFATTAHNKYNKIVIFFDLNLSNTDVYYFDDLKLYERTGGGGGGGTSSGLFDFEDGLNHFFAFEGATVDNIANPQPTGNTSARVMKLVKPAGVPFYAGVNSDQTLGAPIINLANGRIFKIKIWSPKANIRVRMRLEQEPNVIQPPAYEIFQTLTTSNQWVTLTFDFTSQALASYSYTRLVLNTDWDTNPAGGETYYIDDITQE